MFRKKGVNTPGAIDLGRLNSVLALALGAAGMEGPVAAELAPEGALDRPPGVKVAAVGLNLNSLALGFSFDTGAVEGLPSPASPCSQRSKLRDRPSLCTSQVSLGTLRYVGNSSPSIESRH